MQSSTAIGLTRPSRFECVAGCLKIGSGLKSPTKGPGLIPGVCQIARPKRTLMFPTAVESCSCAASCHASNTVRKATALCWKNAAILNGRPRTQANRRTISLGEFSRRRLRVSLAHDQKAGGRPHGCEQPRRRFRNRIQLEGQVFGELLNRHPDRPTEKRIAEVQMRTRSTIGILGIAGSIIAVNVPDTASSWKCHTGTGNPVGPGTVPTSASPGDTRRRAVWRPAGLELCNRGCASPK